MSTHRPPPLKKKKKKKKSNSCLGPHIVLHFPLMHGHCHVAGRREGEGDRNRGRERQEHRMKSWGEEGAEMATVFGFQSSPSGKGCAESGLCASAQSQSGEGTRLLCVIINRQCISVSPTPHPHPNEPSPPTNTSLSVHSPVAHRCANKTNKRKKKHNKNHKKQSCCGLLMICVLTDTPAGSGSALVGGISRQAHPISCLMLIKNKEQGQSPLR